MARTLPCPCQERVPEQVWSTNHPSVPLLPSPLSQHPCPGGFGSPGAPALSIPVLSRLFLHSPALSELCPCFQPPRPLAGAESQHSGRPEHRFALMDTQGTPMENSGIPNRTQLLRIHLAAVVGVCVSPVTSHQGCGRVGAPTAPKTPRELVLGAGRDPEDAAVPGQGPGRSDFWQPPAVPSPLG